MKVTGWRIGLVAGFAVCAGQALGALSYESFGAVGDGKADDRKAIVATHAEANRRGESVRATDGKTYYVGGGSECAIVRTDVDFGAAKFVIDDRKPEKIASPLFHLVPDGKEYPLKGVAKLRRGQAELGVKPKGPCLIRVANDRVKRYIRYGLNQNSGTSQQETFIVDAEGRIDPAAPIVWDYDTVTRMTAFPMDARTLTVKGGVFVTIANQHESKYHYHSRGFRISRSNVRIEGLRHEVTGELDHGAPYGGFLAISTCANVMVTGCVFTAHRTYKTIGSAGKTVSMGSYDLSVNSAVNVSFVDCRQTTDISDGRYWGLLGSNYSKNLLYDRCEFSRFDAHMGVANATIRNSRLGYMGINAIGFGTLTVENTTVLGSSFINLRNDYGSTWEGDFIIRNCRYVPNAGKWRSAPTIIGGSNHGMHDFGYVCHMPRRIVIDGLEIDDTMHPAHYAGPQIFGWFNPKRKDASYVEKYPYVLTEEVVLRNVRSVSGKPPFIGPNGYMFKDVKIVSE